MKTNEEKNGFKDDSYIEHSNKEMVSFSLNVTALQIISAIFISRLLIYYETNVGLSIVLIGLGYSIYTIWDAFNEPFSGYISDHPNRLWKKWGKRFPWIIFSSVPITLSFFLIFIPPDPKVNEWATFFWFLGILCLYDGIYSIWELNYNSLMPDKFRSPKERTKISSVRIPFDVAGLVIGLILPSLIIDYEDQSSYIMMSFIVMVILLVLMALSIPGLREDKVMRERALKAYNKERESFFKGLKNSFKHKNFRVWVIAGIFIFAWDALLIASIPYFIRYVLIMDPDAEILLYIPYLLGSIISMPIWARICNKKGHWKLYKTLIAFTPLSFLPILFVSDIISSLITVAIMGTLIGGLNVAFYPMIGDLMDEAALIHGEHFEGRYNGMYRFVKKAGQFIQIIVIVLIHSITNFNTTVGATQSELAIWGIRIQMGLVPMILMFIQAFVYIKWWDLTSEKTKSIKSKLKELNL